MAQLYRDNRTFFGVEDDTWTTLALWAILSMNGIIASVNQITYLLLEDVTIWDTAIITPIMAVFILLGTTAALKKLRRREFILVSFIAISWILSFFINSNMRTILQMYYFRPIMIEGICGIICIANFNNWEKFKKIGKYFIFIGIALFFITAFYNMNEELNINYMSISYNNLIFIIGAFWLAIHNCSILMWILAPIGAIAIIIGGCRGALVCIAVYIVAEFIFNKKIHIVARAIFFIAVVLFVFNIETIMIEFASIAEQYGYESRTIEMFFEGTLNDDSGRGRFYDSAVEVIQEHLIFGCGMGGSSYHLYQKVHGVKPGPLDVSYAHNLVLDFYMDYGILLGTFLILILVIGIIFAYIKSRNNKNSTGMLFFIFSLSIPKLMLSSTYMSESVFFLLIGLLINLIFNRTDRQQQLSEVAEE